jgi:hypothetical protein
MSGCCALKLALLAIGSIVGRRSWRLSAARSNTARFKPALIAVGSVVAAAVIGRCPWGP